jgi:NAD(P)-dependent dehydrogenase (short-subunit alcohol dehydrogenase family)
MKIDLTGRVALVTGSTRGIGKSIAETLIGCGAKVAIVGRDKEKAKKSQGRSAPPMDLPVKSATRHPSRR